MVELIQKVVGSSQEGIKDKLNGIRTEMITMNRMVLTKLIHSSRLHLSQNCSCIHMLEFYGVFRWLAVPTVHF